MATAATDELILLERVFLRLGSAETDEQLEAAVCKFLPPVLLKLSSSQEAVRKKVMELLIHINKRIKSRPLVQLPIEALLLQYQDPSASSFVINFTIIYIKMGYPRMDISKQAQLIPIMINAIPGKPIAHQDSLMLIMMPALGHVKVPLDPGKRANFLNLQEEPQVKKKLLDFMLDVLLLPYGAITQNENQPAGQSWPETYAPPGMSAYAFKRVMGENAFTADQLEQTKCGIVKFLAGGFLPESDILIHLIVASADTRFSVTNLADLELRKFINILDWSSIKLVAPLYSLFLGSEGLPNYKAIKPEMKRLPACIRIRLKLLHYLCRVTKDGFIIPSCIQVAFDALYGTNDTNSKLKSLALQFTLNFVHQCSLSSINQVGKVVLNGMVKLIHDQAEPSHILMGYTIIGHLGQRIPSLVNRDLNLLRTFFESLTTTDGDSRRTIRDALICMTSAFVVDKGDEDGKTSMVDFLSNYIESPEAYVRFVTVHYLATIFPSDHAPSRYLLLLASGDQKSEVQSEALKCLYGTAYKTERSKHFAKFSCVPDFSNLMSYIFAKTQDRLNSNNKISVGNKILPFSTATYVEIISYLRICLSKSSKITHQSDTLDHPCEFTPLIGRYLDKLYKENSNSVYHYVDVIVLFGQATGDEVALSAFLEVIGTIPVCIVEKYCRDKLWVQNLLLSKKEFVRELAAKILAIFMAYTPIDEFENQISKYINSTKEKSIENQHSAIIALSYILERRLVIKKSQDVTSISNWETYLRVVKVLCDFIEATDVALSTAAINGIGMIGKTFSLPLLQESDSGVSKKGLVEKLFAIFKNVKTNSKLKERVVLTLGYICVGEDFPFTKLIADELIKYAQETKDINLHFCIGEALVSTVQGPGSENARDAWTVLPVDHKVGFSKSSDELLIFVLDELLSIVGKTHPNSRQAVSIWLLTILKHNYERECLVNKFPAIHSAFLDLLSEKSDIVQDIATKGLYLVYNSCPENKREILVTDIMNKILHGRNEVLELSGKNSSKSSDSRENTTGGNLTTYKEICALAADLNRPELAYQFLHLANNNALWTSKKGAAFGFTTTSTSICEDILNILPIIIPKLYRCQFDPIPKVQQSFSNIWRAVVPSTNKALEQYHEEILGNLTEKLTHGQFRIRLSACLALTDLLKTPNVPILYEKYAAELWKQLFRVMDDVHEGTRVAAGNATKILSRMCIRHCDVSHGKSGEKVLQAILPVLLEVGITHPDYEIRMVSLETISQLVSSAGSLLKPSLGALIPSLLTAIGELESTLLSRTRNEHANSAEVQEKLDDITATVARNHFSIEAITKCIIYIDSTVLKEMMPKIMDLMKTSLKYGTKIACANFLVKLSVQLKQDFQPYAGKVLTVLVNGLKDRNSGLRKSSSVTIGHMVGCAKESSLDKLFNTLNSLYTDQEDEIVRLTVGQTLQSINNHNQDIIKKYSDIVMPLTFFAMHAEKSSENEKTLEVWNELWSELTPGTEVGIKQNFRCIINILNIALESSSWTTKAQAANAVSTIASKLGSGIEDDARSLLMNMLISGLQGRTWNGKERLLNALAILASNNKEALEANIVLRATVIDILYRESKKENLEYRRHALKAFTDVLHELNQDKFMEVYEIAENILDKIAKKSDDEDDDSMTENKKKRDDRLKLQETVYESLGKAWPTCKDTQDKYSIKFLTHCYETLPVSTRPIQVTILVTLGLFIDKLVLLKRDFSELSDADKEQMDAICAIFVKILRFAIGIAKYTRIRKEALNIVIYLSKKLEDMHYTKQLGSISNLMKDMLVELSKDNQPEIRSRIVNIKEMFKF